ncbi:MAG: hypothetical protein LBK57_06705 [Clostridiales Family XIII bacterium]|jgi:hypothetical protein|nr:hypothetical protein [Clostridiales Family XIII bacterium]
MHEISARFTEDRIVAFAFDLRGAALADGTQAGPETPIENTANDAGAPASNFPAVIFVIVVIGAALLIGTLILRGKRA